MTRKQTQDGEAAAPDPASEAYGDAVAEILEATPRNSDWRPVKPMALRIVRRRAPQSIDVLEPEEREQLAAILFPEPLETVLSPGFVVGDFPLSIEMAAVEDETGAVRYRLYGWDFGAGWLMPARGLEVVAMGTQHDLEHWNLAQRDVFWAMDHAYRRKDHGFEQPLSFCWWDQTCWDEVAAAQPGSMQSEPYVRERLLAAAAQLAAAN